MNKIIRKNIYKNINNIMQKIIHIIKQLYTYISTKKESIFKIFEVIFIGFTSIFISIKANNISNVANKIAESQLEIMNAEIQPIFYIRDEYLLDSDGNEDTQKLIIEIIDGKAENIVIEPITIINLSQLQSDNSFIDKDVRVPYYYNSEYISGKKQAGIVASAFMNGNFENYRELKYLLWQNDIYPDIYTILKISYSDIRQVSHVEYYLFEEILDVHWHGSEQYYQSTHLDDNEGEIFYNNCMNIDSTITLDYLGSGSDSLPRILELFK